MSATCLIGDVGASRLPTCLVLFCVVVVLLPVPTTPRPLSLVWSANSLTGGSPMAHARRARWERELQFPTPTHHSEPQEPRPSDFLRIFGQCLPKRRFPWEAPLQPPSKTTSEWDESAWCQRKLLLEERVILAKLARAEASATGRTSARLVLCCAVGLAGLAARAWSEGALLLDALLALLLALVAGSSARAAILRAGNASVEVLAATNAVAAAARDTQRAGALSAGHRRERVAPTRGAGRPGARREGY